MPGHRAGTSGPVPFCMPDKSPAGLTGFSARAKRQSILPHCEDRFGRLLRQNQEVEKQTTYSSEKTKRYQLVIRRNFCEMMFKTKNVCYNVIYCTWGDCFAAL